MAFFRDWLQDDLMKINTEDDSYPVWVPFSVKVTLQEDGNLKIEEFPDDEPIQDNTGTVPVQGGHKLWKTGKMVKKKIPAGKNQGILNRR